MSSNPPYNSKLRSSKPKKAIIKPKPEIRKNCKLNSKISPKFSTNSSRIRCTNCKELLFSEDIEEHKENCTTNQKRCPYCQVFFPNRLISSHINVCNTSPNSFPNIDRTSNHEPKTQTNSFLKKKKMFNEPHSNINSENLFNFQRNPINGQENTCNNNNTFTNINANNNNNISNDNRNTNNLRRNTNFSNSRSSFSFNPTTPLFQRFSTDNSGNHFFFSNNESSNSNFENNRRSSQDPFIQTINENNLEDINSANVNNNNPNSNNNINNNNNNNTNGNSINEGSSLFGTNNNNNSNDFFFANMISFNNPFRAFDGFDRIFGRSGIFSRIHEEIRASNFQRSQTFIPFARDERENAIFDSFSLFFENPMFRDFRENRARGLNEEEIKNIPTSIFIPMKPNCQDKKEQNSNKSCVICLEDFKSGDQLKVLVCGHQFHNKCIDHWLPVKGSCPICRVNITQVTIV